LQPGLVHCCSLQFSSDSRFGYFFVSPLPAFEMALFHETPSLFFSESAIERAMTADERFVIL
jgi:hypothetical protein